MTTTERLSNVLNQMSFKDITLQDKEEWGEVRRQGNREGDEGGDGGGGWRDDVKAGH